ncbi:MAG TPA: nickel pincer cofactor biosynthesis protein LarB [Candidatus Acidoferrales bacterium]|nr:nickel pincer cofactor biosynthesis protein LarB [Candidatus Acidoferrales bacterium]
MRIAYLECFSGISGNMLLGALLNAGVNEDLLRQTVASLNIGADLRVTRVNRKGISATNVEVLIDGASLDGHAHSAHKREHEHEHAHPDAGSPHHHHSPGEHDHSHHPSSHRSLSKIKEIIRNVDIPVAAREIATRAFEVLGYTEARIHNVAVEKIHFHEVGAVDAIVDIICGAVGCHALGVDAFVCSSLNVGGGTIQCAHGEYPVPAPATLELLKGAPIYSSGTQAELVTPTGAAMVRALECSFSSFPQMAVETVGYGAGSRDLNGHPNVLRIAIGEIGDRVHDLIRSLPAHHVANQALPSAMDGSSRVSVELASHEASNRAMNPGSVRTLLEAVRDGGVAPEQALQRLRDLPFENIGFARIDHHRSLRSGLPEVIYAAGKTPAQVSEIFVRMAEGGSNVLATRADAARFEAVKARVPQAEFYSQSGCIVLRRSDEKRGKGKIAVVCAGTSDLAVAEEASVTADLMGNEVEQICDVGVAGLHRLLAERDALTSARVLIVCAGMEGALPSVVAGLVSAPVICVPTSVGYGASFGGLAAMLGMLNSCSPNTAVVNIDNGFGAAYLASMINRQ